MTQNQCNKVCILNKMHNKIDKKGKMQKFDSRK